MKTRSAKNKGKRLQNKVKELLKENFNLICQSIKIESESWIGSKAIIGPGNIIGQGSVIKMGSIITKDVPPQSLVTDNKTINNFFIK